MKMRSSVRVLTLCLAVVMGSVAWAAERQLSVAISTGTPGQAGSFAGTFIVASFSSQDGQVLATGLMNGVLQTAAGPVTSANSVSVSVTTDQASCQLLRLQIAPQDLSVVGQTVHLDQRVLEVAAQPSTGNILCSAAGAQNDPQALATLLNQLLGALAK
jgi:hypothetical protein